MKPKTKIASANLPGGTLLELYEHDGNHEIRFGNAGLMESRMHNSEEELARLGCAGLGSGARVLIGGLGMGFTLRAALDVLPEDATVIQVEIVPELVEWNRGPLAVHTGSALDDPRTEIVIDDFALEVQRQRNSLDAILVDIDNGPSALIDEQNAWAYSGPGLTAMRRALKPTGRLAFWSAYEEPQFIAQLRSHGMQSEQHTVHARPGRKGPKYRVIVASVA